MVKTNNSLTRRALLAQGASVGGLAAMSITIPGAALAQSFPRRPITLVVMYSAGGGTDSIMRKLADEMARAQGWTITVVNKPGAVGGVATQYVSAARPDGYTLLGAANYNRFVRVLGHADFVPWQDWLPMKAADAPASWSVRADSPFQSMEEVIEEAKANPGKLTISTSGTGGVWHEVSLIIANMAGIEMKYVPYKGGKPATLAGLQGETDIAGGGLHEHIDLIRSGEMRNLCHASSADVTLKDGRVLPSIGGILPETQKILPVGATYNFMVPRALPPEVLQQLVDAFRAAATSDGFKEMMAQNFFQPGLLVGEEADRQGALMEAMTADIFNKNKDAIGADIRTAEELGLPAPEDFDSWWPPQGYVAPPIS
ncbi:tripartite tricarboxylate transporter substrate binding protein [Salipiger sp. 1_MG-2023]|uniref:Bug family tripartite tricarboxylate transporter substrate binding protein n=1 Tax=Salipiger sp. 1_MG-2023 TaxID=3062665 RepID=UPI0026E1DEB7|nr:tripartite tricarboxylate transporter substrate binding protein [Salipiger sp. 1_MG-2023]MDO6585195.1 tripartite tricarboxylate transporter substrate binding protein [Salipiger sp. 1_MG-2023]